MRKLTLLLLAFIFLSTNLLAIDINRKFGKVSKGELLMEVYEKDSSAEAVILFDIGKTDFQYNTEKGFQMIFERQVRIKIINKDGFDYADFSIPLYKDNDNVEKISALKAYTYNIEDEKIVKTKLKNKDVYIVEDTRNRSLTKFSLPSVKQGSVIEISYSITSDFFYNLQSWSFQHFIPTIWSEYTVEIPEYFSYNKTAKGYLTYEVNTTEYIQDFITITQKVDASSRYVTRTEFQQEKVDYTKQRFILAVKDAPAMKKENYMLSANNYLSSIEFELAQIKFPGSPLHNYSQSWESITEKLIKHSDFGDQIKNGKFLSNIIDNIKAEVQNPEEQIYLIHRYLINNIKWNERNDLFTSKSLKKTLQEKHGNSADINLLLVLMLREAGFTAEPVIISTRDHGLLNLIYPSLSQMNYVIALVKYNGNDILIDATDPYCLPGMLPPRCINDKGRIISIQTPGWVNVEPKDKYTLTFLGNFNLTQQGIKGTLVGKYEGFAAYSFRNKYKNFNSEEEYIADLESENAGIKINEYEFENIDSIYKPITYKFSDISIDSYENLGNLIYFNPVLFDQMKENPFKLEERNFPVDYNYPYNQKYIFNYTLPEGYELEEMPSNEQLILPDNSASYKYIIRQNENMLQLTIQFDINKRQFLPDEYFLLKKMYNRIITKEKEQIVLKKI